MLERSTTRYLILLIVCTSALLFPLVLFAEGLVPCDGVNCQLCHLVKLGQNILNWLIVISVSFAGLLFAIGGLLMIFSGGNEGKVTQGKNLMTDAVIGIVILLAAWLILDTVMKNLTKFTTTEGNFNPSQEEFGPWNSIKCVVQPIYGGGAGPAPFGDGRSCSGTDLEVGDACYAPGRCNAAAPSSCADTSQWTNAINDAAALYGIEPARIRAIITVESNGDPNIVSNAGAVGLMQILPTTAPECGLSASELTDPIKNINCGAWYYSEQLKNFKNHNRAAAAYNGGGTGGALAPSNDCPGLLAYECPFAEPGCCDSGTVTSTTTCAFDPGYQETREYVDKINVVQSHCSGLSVIPPQPAGEICFPGDGSGAVCLTAYTLASTGYSYPSCSGYTTPNKFFKVADHNPGLKLTPNFSLGELAQSYKGQYAYIDPSALVKLEGVRAAAGSSINLTSGFRSPEYNNGVGGAPCSRHMYGDSFDITSPGLSPSQLENVCKNQGASYTSTYASTNHTHCDWR